MNNEEIIASPKSEDPIPEEILDVLAQNSQSGQCEEITVEEEILSIDIPAAAIECDYREDVVGELSSEKETEYKEILKNIKR